MNILYLTTFNLLAIILFALLIRFDYLEIILSRLGNLRAKRYAAVQLEKSKSRETL